MNEAFGLVDASIVSGSTGQQLSAILGAAPRQPRQGVGQGGLGLGVDSALCNPHPSTSSPHRSNCFRVLVVRGSNPLASCDSALIPYAQRRLTDKIRQQSNMNCERYGAFGARLGGADGGRQECGGGEHTGCAGTGTSSRKRWSIWTSPRRTARCIGRIDESGVSGRLQWMPPC